MQFSTRKIAVLGAQMVPKWNQNGHKNPGISWTFRATLPRRLQGGQMEAKELQNGAKMEPKGSQMERKWSSKRAKIDKTTRAMVINFYPPPCLGTQWSVHRVFFVPWSPAGMCLEGTAAQHVARVASGPWVNFFIFLTLIFYRFLASKLVAYCR